MSNINLNELATRIYEQNKAVGWWDDPNRCLLQTLQLVSTEVAEATEGERKDLNDDHLPDRKMGEVELADALIRTLDVAGRYCIKYNPEKAGASVDPFCEHDTIGAQHLGINGALIDFAREVYLAQINPAAARSIEHRYHTLVDSIIFVAERNDYELFGALEEKLAYNKNRQDHKRSERAKPHGKGF
ncbi:nucleoside triphosphate pyrophosphohydrolase [Alteromonas phage vB_AmaS-R9Y3]|nr:nucleoside triphosphate pyrophosphohydrolase [Alteromonas phage vB_AmaS-R9Y3]